MSEKTTNDDHNPEEDNNTPEVIAPDQPSAITITEKKKRRISKKIIVIVSIIVALLAAGALFWWFSRTDQTPISTNTDTQSVDMPGTTEMLPADLEEFSQPTTGELWYKEAKPIADPGYITNTDGSGFDGVKYFEVGKHGDATIIQALVEAVGGFGILLFEHSPSGKTSFIARPNANLDYSTDTSTQTSGWDNNIFASSVSINKDTHYGSLTVPKSLPVPNNETITPPSYTYGTYVNDPDTGKSNDSPQEGLTVTTVATYGSNTLVKKEQTHSDTNLTTINYVLVTPIGTEVSMVYQPINTTIDDYTWSNNVSVKGTIGGVVRGCGAVGTSVSRADSLSDSDFVAIGKTDKGQTIYGFKDTSINLVKVVYDEYLEANNYDGAPASVSFDTFIANHAIFAYKSVNNGWLIYTNNDYVLAGGCGKPVIYLYPTSTEKVSVKVGANVTVSDPFYPQTTGWKDVIARPDGSLTYNGKLYHSLFWEGTGYGEYPAITRGTVVKRADVLQTIRTQLTAQGLTPRESQDFVDFWQNRIPNKPYVLLSWFNTIQLNTLAPLRVTPRPDTLIRVFLDMRGLDAPISIMAQSFDAPTRNGFTVVEWGGLLTGKK